MTDPTGSHRRDFLKASTAAAAGLGLLPNVHAKGNDTIKVGLIGCGGRGTGAADNICEAAGTTYNIKIHALADVFEDHLRNCRDAIRNSEHGKDKFDVADDRCFVGFDAYQKVIDCCDLVMLATPPGFRPQHIEAVDQGRQEPLHREARGRRPHRHPQGAGRLRGGQEQEAVRRRRHPAPPRGRLHREHQADPRGRDRRGHLGPRLLEPGGHLG